MRMVRKTTGRVEISLTPFELEGLGLKTNKVLSDKDAQMKLVKLLREGVVTRYPDFLSERECLAVFGLTETRELTVTFVVSTKEGVFSETDLSSDNPIESRIFKEMLKYNTLFSISKGTNMGIEEAFSTLIDYIMDESDTEYDEDEMDDAGFGEDTSDFELNERLMVTTKDIDDILEFSQRIEAYKERVDSVLTFNGTAYCLYMYLKGVDDLNEDAELLERLNALAQEYSTEQAVGHSISVGVLIPNNALSELNKYFGGK